MYGARVIDAVLKHGLWKSNDEQIYVDRFNSSSTSVRIYKQPNADGEQSPLITTYITDPKARVPHLHSPLRSALSAKCHTQVFCLSRKSRSPRHIHMNVENHIASAQVPTYNPSSLFSQAMRFTESMIFIFPEQSCLWGPNDEARRARKRS